jgi:phage virion morphogenesis protein
MSGVLVEAREDGLQALGGALTRMKQLGDAPRPIWNAIGQYGETSTRIRFKRQAGPDGQAWKPSRRVVKQGGTTLQLSARLLRSITHRANNSGAEWGSNVIYARIHQLGGKIERHAFSSTLRLRTGKGGALLRQKDHANLAVFARKSHKNAVEKRFTVGAHSITMPARPYLGVNEQDGREILHLANAAVDQAAQNRGGA